MTMKKKHIRKIMEDLDFRDQRRHDDLFVGAIQQWIQDNAVAEDESGVSAALEKYLGEYVGEQAFVESGVIEPDPWDVIRTALENAGIEYVQWHVDAEDTIKAMDNTEGYQTYVYDWHWFWAAD